MKKIKLSLAAITLVVAVAGTTMANKLHKTDDRCSYVDPAGDFCVGGRIFCCIDDNGQTVYKPI
ncbi:MAG TPA: hypothetical protein VF008_18685 [Niastella sp.]